jgi:hypothetical protein
MFEKIIVNVPRKLKMSLYLRTNLKVFIIRNGGSKTIPSPRLKQYILTFPSKQI